jgi:hypothetical protein
MVDLRTRFPHLQLRLSSDEFDTISILQVDLTLRGKSHLTPERWERTSVETTQMAGASRDRTIEQSAGTRPGPVSPQGNLRDIPRAP